MNNKDLDSWFTETFLKGTCFDSIKELQNDKTSYMINAPRALVACNLDGAYRATKLLNEYLK